MARALFIAGPAAWIAAPIVLFDPVTAGIVAAAVAAIGFSITTARPERGEH